MKPTVRTIFLCVVLIYSWGCVPKTAKLQKSVVPPDKTLFETGEDYLKKGQFIKSRLAFQTLMNTYQDSDLAPDALMAIADSYYDEGGTENLLQAEDSYKNFIVFFPSNPKAPDAQLKVIALNHRMMRSPDRDQQYSFKTEEAIQRFLSQFPDSDYVPIVKRYLLEVQENRALANLGVGQFYEHDRGNLAGALQRYKEIPEKSPNFSQMDEVLFRMAGIMEKAKGLDEAATDYGKIVSAYPFSKHAEEAKARLMALGKPIPEVDTQLAAANQARIKPSEGFSPLKPFIEFGKALGFVAPPDIYAQAKKEQEEKAKIAQAEAAKAGGAPAGAGNDIQIQSIIRKSATGETQDTTVLGSASTPAQPGSVEKKKEPTRTRKKTVKKPT
jgi:outer membrane protein assembly factor BamD